LLSREILTTVYAKPISLINIKQYSPVRTQYEAI
jgi:hypothetical protein